MVFYYGIRCDILILLYLYVHAILFIKFLDILCDVLVIMIRVFCDVLFYFTHVDVMSSLMTCD